MRQRPTLEPQTRVSQLKTKHCGLVSWSVELPAAVAKARWKGDWETGARRASNRVLVRRRAAENNREDILQSGAEVE